jgi:glycosyltransferase involved in cell wall biosynthesis
MVQLMLEHFGGDRRKIHGVDSNSSAFGVDCYHVNARLSRTTDEIGSFQARKLPLLIGYCLQAVWCRYRYCVTDFYYIPAPGKSAALYRDWLVMLLCRPFFKNVIFHWHAAALTEWLEKSASVPARWLTHRLLGRPNLSIVLSHYNISDAQKLSSRQTKIVHNGIDDPCPDFEREVLPRRLARLSARKKLLAGGALDSPELEQAGPDVHLVNLLYLSQCSREKGLFDALDAVALANGALTASGSAVRFQLCVAGDFVDAQERRIFEERVAKPDLQLASASGAQNPQRSSAVSDFYPAVQYLGFLSGSTKHRALVESDCLCFPTYYHAESFGLVIIEAMAFGLPILTTRWRSIPELFPADYPGLVQIQSPQSIVEGLLRLITAPLVQQLRKRFVLNFNLSRHLTNLAHALHSIERGRDSTQNIGKGALAGKREM